MHQFVVNVNNNTNTNNTNFNNNRPRSVYNCSFLHILFIRCQSNYNVPYIGIFRGTHQISLFLNPYFPHYSPPFFRTCLPPYILYHISLHISFHVSNHFAPYFHQIFISRYWQPYNLTHLSPKFAPNI